ncbi:MAG: T9SS type A sorting domain-containing protein, partial [Sediminibacterium sp.]|nr:T9SS type A sorting domain-containing protein [Sediminibacterium sp.]
PKVKILTDNLAADTFTIIMYPSYLDSAQGYSYKVVIKSPPNLYAYTIFNSQENKLSLQLSGGNVYHITINKQQITTTQKYTELLLAAGLNKITVTTDKACQDSFTQEIFVSEVVKLYPNPVTQNLSVYMAGAESEVELSIYAENGQKYLQQKIHIPANREVILNVHSYPAGTYLLDLKGKTLRGTYTFIKL